MSRIQSTTQQTTYPLEDFISQANRPASQQLTAAQRASLENATFNSGGASPTAGSGSLDIGAQSQGGTQAQLLNQLISLLSQLVPQLQASSQSQPASGTGGQQGAQTADLTASQGPSDSDSDATSALTPSATASAASPSSVPIVDPSADGGDGDDTSDSSPDSSAAAADSTGAPAATTQSATGQPSLDSVLTQLINAISQLTGALGGGANSAATTSAPSLSSVTSSPTSAGASALPTTSSASAGTGLASGTGGTSPAGGTNAASGISPAGGTNTASVTSPPGGSGDLATNKQAVLAAAKQAGATPAQQATILAIGQLETQHLSASERDTSKDGTDSANYSAFNLNKDLLQKLGWNPATGPDLNDPKNLPYAVALVTKGLNQFGTNGFLAYLRGGSSGYANPQASNVQDYIQAINGAASTMQANPSLQTNGQRVATFVQHI